MLLYFLQRASSLLLTLLLASVVVFGVLEVLPGNSAQVMLGPDASAEAVQALTRQLGLDQPVGVRYWQWISGLLQGDMGNSYAYGTPVWPLLMERFSLTVPLALLAMLITSLCALCAGIYAASRHNRLGDYVTMGITQIGMAVPNFWFAIMLVMVFAVHLRWLPAGGFHGWSAGWGQAAVSLLLPALALAVVQTAILTRITRSSMLEVMQEDFVRTARARGLSPRAALWRHVLRNGMIPVLTVMGLQFANLLAGTIVIENVFYLPGLGRLIFQSIANRDVIVVRNAVMVLATMVMVVNFLVDVLYAALDPRLRHAARRSP